MLFVNQAFYAVAQVDNRIINEGASQRVCSSENNRTRKLIVSFRTHKTRHLVASVYKTCEHTSLASASIRIMSVRFPQTDSVFSN